MRRLLCGLTVAGTLACADGPVTRYVGSAMYDAAPDSAGSFELTLYSHTDTSFSGILQVGAPIPGTGPAFAWHEGTTLNVVTVSAAGGDTILWTSRSADAELGGRFEISGGAHVGHGGTWRARLTNGPAATEATLKGPRRYPAPPVSTLWPLLALTAAGIWAVRWIRSAPTTVAISDGSSPASPSAPARSYSGVSGWLALFLLGQSMALILALMRMRDVAQTFRDGFPIASVVTGMRPLIVLESAVQALLPAVIVLGLVLTVRRDRHAPRFWFAYLALSAAYLLSDIAMGVHIHAEMSRLLGSGYAKAMANEGGGTTTLLRQALMTIVWALYWVRSERVRATFGSAALDETARAISPRGGGAGASDPAESLDHGVRGETREPTIAVGPPVRRRRALRIVGAIAGGLLLLLGWAAWASRVRPYSVPAGTDILAGVAGRWDWARRTAPCSDSAHVIAFPGDGRVMTITQQNRWTDSLGRDRTTATYDILRTTSSSIRGAIRGEERRTPDGQPVVWDLVLVGPDEYRWHRTDWSSGWGYTGGFIRCGAGTGAAASSR